MDNVLKAVVDAIAESDNEIGGQLLTRLRESHVHGRDDAQLETANPTRLVSPVAVFTAGIVGSEIDLLLPATGAASGFEGTYLAATFIDSTNITLTKLDGTAPNFTDTDPIVWRIATLRVETTLRFAARDRRLKLWVGDEPNAITYAQLVQTAGAQEFRGLGDHRLFTRGSILAASPTTITLPGASFVAGDVGKALYVLPVSTPTGNEGPQLITAVAGDSKSATVSPGGLTTTETDVWFVIKEYTDDTGRLTGLRPPQTGAQTLHDLSPVMDGSQSFSALDKLRRALLTDYATEEELDRIGRNLAVTRLPGINDETMRSLLQTLPYLPRSTVYGIELILGCLFPDGGYTIYEDVVNFPNKVFVLIDSLGGDTSIFEGKTFLGSGSDVTASIDPERGGDALGRGGREKKTSATATSVIVTHTVISVLDVLVADYDDQLDMTVLPSADTPAWTFVAEADSGPIEADVFSIVSGQLQQTPDMAPSDDGGRYKRAISPSWTDGSVIEMTGWFKLSAHAASGFSWGFKFDDDAIDRQYGIWWSLTQAQMGATPAAATVGPVSHGLDVEAGDWVFIELRRESFEGKHYITAKMDGSVLFDKIDSTVFPTTTANEVSFGYVFQGGSVQNWTALWERIHVVVRDNRNYYNVTGNDGAFGGADDNLTSAAAPFLAGDVDKHVRIRTAGSAAAATINVGLWNIKTFNSTSSVELEGILSGAIVTVSTVAGEHFIELLDPWFVPEDVGKEIVLSGSALGNDDSHIVLEYVSPKKIRVDSGLLTDDFVAEPSLVYKFNPYNGTTLRFVASTAVVFEVIDASSVTAKTLTLRDALPIALTPCEVGYTSVLSAQILRNEFVVNEGADGAAANVYYPFYIFDLDRATRQLIDEITAAGVIPAYEREF